MFKLVKTDDKARTGIIQTKSGPIETPFFMPVATKMQVKCLPTHLLKDMKNTAVISNAFILYLKPGDEHVKQMGGIKKYMNYHGVNVTDSGGYQMYRESFLEKTTDEGVLFKSPFNGSKHFVTPEKDMLIQINLDSDIAMALDVMPNFHGVERPEIEEAVRRTTLWAKSCKLEHDRLQAHLPKEKRQLLFAISQGGIHADLREQSIRSLVDLDFDGFSVGGLGMGEPPEEQAKMVAIQRSVIPEDKPLYLMGIGNPRELLDSIAKGADMFDSMFPTQNARRGTLFTSQGKLRLMRKEYDLDDKPIDPNCTCHTCKNYTRSYIRFLISQKEASGYTLATYHQLHYLTDLMKRARDAIKAGTFKELHKEVVDAYEAADK